MQAQGSVIQGGMIGNFMSIYQNEGTRGLWKASIKVNVIDMGCDLSGSGYRKVLFVPMLIE